MKIYKQKQFLVFEFDNNRKVMYNLADKQSIGFSGKPVKDLKKQLSGLSIDDVYEYCTDKNYANFLKYVQNKHSDYYNNIFNIGTILDKIKINSKYEQLFSAGLTNIDTRGINCDISKIKNGLLKFCINHKDIQLNNNLITFYNENPNIFTLFFNLNFITLNEKDFFNIIQVTNHFYSNNHHSKKFYTIKYDSTFTFNMLIFKYKYNMKSLLNYIDKLKTFEAITNMEFILSELLDYNEMMSEISPKYEKYPRHFLTTHHMACRTYNRLTKYFNEDLFKTRINKSLEYTYKDYVFLYPNSTQEIKDEAVQQNNSISTYIQSVIDCKCDVMFLRKKETPKKSLITLELHDGIITQALQAYNEPLTPIQKQIVEQYNYHFNKVSNDTNIKFIG